MDDLAKCLSERNALSAQPGNATAIAAGPIVTAVPVGRDWCVKIRSPRGEVTLPGVFPGRLPALGAALLVSAQIGGRAVA
jgi:hypothetical protein